VNYIGFWITGLVIVGSGIGAVLAPFLNPAVAVFKSAAFKGFSLRSRRVLCNHCGRCYL